MILVKEIFITKSLVVTLFYYTGTKTKRTLYKNLLLSDEHPYTRKITFNKWKVERGYM